MAPIVMHTTSAPRSPPPTIPLPVAVTLGDTGGAALASWGAAVSMAAAVAAVATGVLAVSLLAGAVRVLPLLLAPGVPLRLAPALGRGVLSVSLETALFVAPPIAWALAAARLVDRGEARGLFAIGVRPLRIVAGTWPSALVVVLAGGLAAASWGQEAAAPGRLVRDLLAGARAACLRARPPSAVDVPR